MMIFFARIATGKRRESKKDEREFCAAGTHGDDLFPGKQAIYDDREKFELYAQLRTEFGKYDCEMSLDQLRRIMAIIDEGNGILHGDGTYDCAAYDTPRDFDWCDQKNCPKYAEFAGTQGHNAEDKKR